ncbi:ribosomal-protein-alanine N-acetyltransferase [compost metagenome]
MEVRNLEQVGLEELLSVINLSFSDYIVPLKWTLEILKSKIESEDVKMTLSTGVFDADKMVACMLHGIRNTDDGLMVYNAATGVIPDYRGKGLVAKMYDHLLPELKKLQVKKMILEVITGNHSAIKAYEKMGYTVARKLDCYNGNLQIKKNSSVATLKELDSFSWSEFTSFWDILPSWQNAIQTLENSKENCRVIGAYMNDLLVGCAIFNPTSRKINQFAVAKDHRGQGIGSQIFSHINEVVEQQEVYVYNVDHTADSTLGFLKSMGLREKIAQFEMSRMCN